MAYKFKAIEQDKRNLDMKANKITEPNLAYGGSTIPEFDPSKAIEDMITSGKIFQIDLEQIKPRQTNDFKMISNVTLKKSILEIGLISPIIVRKSDNNKYIIISGHRRFNTYKDILADLRIEKESLGKLNLSTQEIQQKIDKYSKIPCIVFTVVEKQSDLYGTDSQYITLEQEEKMYKASNLENRQISSEDLTKHIMYFYDMINNDKEYKDQILEKMNEGGKRKATKLNMPKAIASIITNDLGFNVAPISIWRYLSIVESKENYPKLNKILVERLENKEKIKTVYNDYKMAIDIYNDDELETEEKREYITRIEKGQNIKEVYNEAYNIKESANINQGNKKLIDTFEKMLLDIKNNNLTIDEAINKVKNMC